MIIQLSTGQILFGSVIITFLIGLIQWLLSIWVKIRLEKSIQYEYDKKIQDYNFFLLQKEQAIKVATLLARWIEYGENPNKILNENEMRDYFEELNKMTLELAIWIPDEEIAKKLMICLSHGVSAPNIRELIIDVRKLVLNKNNSLIKWEDIVVFSVK